jgi:hypothetical protein
MVRFVALQYHLNGYGKRLQNASGSCVRLHSSKTRPAVSSAVRGGGDGEQDGGGSQKRVKQKVRDEGPRESAGSGS